jgi:cell cycle sensor histidine kinase DivJ
MRISVTRSLRALGAYLGSLLHPSVGQDDVDAAQQPSLMASDLLAALLAETAADMITRHDEQGRVQFASEASRRLLGEAPEAILGDGLFERVHIADRPAYRTALSRCVATDEPAIGEFRLRHQNASGGEAYRWVEMRCRLLPTAPPVVLASMRDMSLRRAQEEELTRARDEAESASRAKTQFLANMSHELRTPLNAVIGFSEILNRELFGTLGEQRYRDYARMIHESGEHLLQVVNDILDMSKIEAGKLKLVKEPFDIGALVASCAEVMRHAAETRQISLVIEVQPNLPCMVADRRACKQMLLNVISNAIKFTNAGGSVRVTARAENGMIGLAVADTGIGIDDKDLAKLGNPFVQGDNAYNRGHEGAGLGLSVVKGLARLHGGRLDIASKLGQGTTTTISLPLGEADGENADRPGRNAAMTAA